MTSRFSSRLFAVLTGVALSVAACGSSDDAASGATTGASVNASTSVGKPVPEPTIDTKTDATATTDAESETATGTSDAADLTPMNFQLGWIPNVESAPVILAKSRGYFADEGIDLNILPGGPEVVVDAQIVSGNAEIGSLSSEGLANAFLNGAPLVAIGATYQTSSSAIVTLASSGITKPADLEGRKFGVSQSDARVYTPFFKLVGVDESKIQMVSSGSDPAALISGEVDAMSGTLPNQPIAIEAQGLDVVTIPLADFGYNRWSGVLVVSSATLDDPAKADLVAGALRAYQRGVADMIADPDAAANAVLDAYGTQLGLDADVQRASAVVWAQLAQPKSNTPVLVDADGVASQQAFFDAIGLKVDAAQIFDTSFSANALGG